MSQSTDQANDGKHSLETTPALVISAAIVFLGAAGSRVLGLVREQIAAARFGAGNDIAAFTVSDNLNTLLFDLLVNGMLQAAFVPVLALLAIGGITQRTHFRRVSGALLVLVAGAGTFVALIGIVAAPAFVSLVTALDGDQLTRGADTRQLAIDCTRLILVSLPMFCAVAVLTAGLYALQKPTGPAIAAIARNAAIVVSMLAVGNAMGVRSMAVGVVVGAASMLLIVCGAIRRHDAVPSLSFDFRDPDVRQVLKLALPVFSGLLVSSAVVILDRNLAWGAEEDAVGAMRYATTLVQLVLGLVAAAISIAALPRLAQAHSRLSRDNAEFDRELSRALSLVTTLILPAVVVLGVLATPFVRLLFEHGKTDRDASRLIVIALLLYLPGHLLAAWDQVLIFAFYAQQNTILPVSVGIVSAGAYTVTAIALVDRHGMAGLVIANSVQFAVHTAIMIWLGWKRFGPGAFTRLPVVTGKAGIGSLAVASLAWGAFVMLDRFLPDFSGPVLPVREILCVIVPILLAAGSYVVVASRLGLEEIDELRRTIAAKISPTSNSVIESR